HRLQARHLIGLDPRRRLVLGAVAEPEIVVRADMLAPAIGPDLEEMRTAACADLGADGSRPFIQVEDIVVLNALRRDAVGAGAGANVGPALTALLRRVDSVAVVLAHEDYGQLFEGGEIEALGKDAFLRRAVAEKAGDEGVSAL